MDSVETPTDLKKIVVTGSSGRAGRAVVRDLVAYGFEVTGVDQLKPAQAPGAPHLQADLTDLGETLEALLNADAVVHLANIPAPGIFTPGKTFAQKYADELQRLFCCQGFGLEAGWCGPRARPRWVLPFSASPRYAPVDEAHYPVPESSYALSKVASEAVAEQFARWTGVPFVALRFSNILGPSDYATFPQTCWGGPARAQMEPLGGTSTNATWRSRVVWASLPRVGGADAFIIAAADTVMNRPSRALMTETFPGRRGSGRSAGVRGRCWVSARPAGCWVLNPNTRGETPCRRVRGSGGRYY